MNHAQRTPGRSAWPKAAVLGAAATAGLALLWLLADTAAPPPPDGAAVMLAAPADPPSDVPLPEIQDPPAIVLDALAGVEAGSLEPEQADEGGPRRPPLPGTERAYREAFLVALRKPGVDVDALLDTTIHGRGPDAQKVALLRALLDIQSAKAFDALVTAAEEAETHDGPAGVGVPDFCVRTLVLRAPTDADARAALGRLVARRDSALEPRLRRTAAARVALTGTSSELALLAAGIRGCGDPDLLLGVARSLELNPEAASARVVFTDLPSIAADEEQPLARN